MKIKKDSQVFKDYRIINKIGTGGFSEVYKVEKLNDPTHRMAALKYLVADNKSNASSRFAQEIQICKSINSQYVVKYYDSYISKHEQYLVMEYIQGRSISDFIKINGKLTTKNAVLFASQIARGINELHNAGIIHRDLKSTNILIDEYQNIKIIDLGIALGEDSERFTREKSVIGTVQYMAPELTDITNKNRVTKSADIYALGVLLFEMLTGTFPFYDKEPANILKMHRHKPFPDIRQMVDVPQALANIIIKSTAKDPSKRYKHMWEMALDLDTCLNEKRIYEKPLDINKIKEKKTFADIINSKVFLIGSLIGVSIIIITIIIIALQIR